MLSSIYLYLVNLPLYFFICPTQCINLNVHVPDTYTVVTVQVVLDQRLLEKRLDVDQVFL